MSLQPTAVKSIEQLRKHVPSIVKAVNAEPGLTIGAAVNPLFAIEELGYQIPDDLRRPLEHRIRFSEAQTERLRTLAAEIHGGVGEEFDIESEADLARVLPPLLKLGPDQKLPTPLTLTPQLKWTDRCEDPLEGYRDANTVMKALLEYREIEASEPRLGSRDLYNQVRAGSTRVPATAIVFQLASGSASQ